MSPDLTSQGAGRPLRPAATRITALGLVVAGLTAAAPADRGHAPRVSEPTSAWHAPASSQRPSAADTETLDYRVGGVHVIQRLTRASDVVAVDLYLEGGVQELTASTAGIEELALRASEYGSARYPDTISRQAFARTGSQWVVEPSTDWTLVGFRGVLDQFDSSWAVFADRIVHPTLDSASVILVRDRMRREVRLGGLTPDGQAHHLADSLAFEGHPYSLSPSGTESSLAELTPDIVQRYVRDEYLSSRLLLVVVGNVPRERLEPLVAATLGTLPAGSYSWSPPASVPRRPTSLTFIARGSATNYILGYFAGPSVKSPDYPAFEVATEVLSGMLNASIRGKGSLSYAAYAPYEGRGIATGGLYVSTTQPVLVLALMRQQLQRVKAARFPAWTVHDFEKEFSSAFIMETETSAGQAGALARAQLYDGDYRKATVALDRLRHVSPTDIGQAATTYMRDIQFVYVGDTMRVQRTWVNGM